MADKNPVILVPIGFSDQSILALDQALVFAKAMHADVTILSVINDDTQLRKMFKAQAKDESSLRKAVKAKAKEYAEEYSKKHGVEISVMVASGVVYEEINRVAELIEAELVIMGTNGKPSNLRKRFIGSNAYRTAVQVEPPVITVRGVRSITEINTIIFPLILDRHSKGKGGPGPALRPRF
ncbi:MAG: universal stress protein [Owenweeksia sp.]|nr:universal stress protein [Owenweeksia sp.]